VKASRLARPAKTSGKGKKKGHEKKRKKSKKKPLSGRTVQTCGKRKKPFKIII